MTALLMVTALVAGIALRVPIVISLLVPCLVYIGTSDTVSMSIALQRVVSGVDSFVLLAIPLFLLMGNVANISGIAERMYDSVRVVIGHVRGSQGYINVLVSLGFSWMNGSALADLAGVGKVQVPQMLKHGYPRRFSLGVTGASALIAPIMPPSIPAVIFALAASVSMGGMLMAGALPALLVTAVLLATVWWMSRNWGHLKAPKSSRKEMAMGVVRVIPAMLTPVIVVGGILGGYFTPTEAAAVAVVYMLILGLLYRAISLRGLLESIRTTGQTTAGIMVIIGAATLFAWILSLEQVPATLAAFILENIGEAWLFLLLLNIVLLLLGTFMEAGAVILVLVPVLMPAAIELGIHPLHLGVVVVFNLMIGLLTPPMGLALFVLEAATGASYSDTVRGALLFMPALLVCLVILTYVPEISLFLPRMLGLA